MGKNNARRQLPACYRKRFQYLAILAAMSVPNEQTDLSDARRAEAADRIKARALQLGFQKVGIVGAETLSPEGARLKEWLARGYQGEMGWMARDPEQRADPQRASGFWR